MIRIQKIITAMKLERYFVALLLLLSFSFVGYGQDDNKADKLYKELGYGTAISEYKSTVGEEGKLDRKTMIRLANSYRLIGDYRNAELYYAQIVESSDKALYRLYYAQALQANGKCEQAKKYYLEYDALVSLEAAEEGKVGNDRRGQILANACDQEFTTAQVVLNNETNLNTPSLDFSPTYYQDGLIFVSTRGINRSVQNEDAWLNGKFMDLFYAEIGSETKNFSVPLPLASIINSKFHEGPLTFDQSGSTMYFTRNNFKGGRRGFNAKKITKLKIYGADWDGEEWSNIWELPFNDDAYNHCHPTLSADGQHMYLSSDREGGYGGHDLYISTFTNGEWSTPVNLGEQVNTPGNELFPFVHDDGTLYFASNGHAGLGGLDIFSAQPIGAEDVEQTWSIPTNLGKPINSTKDDFGFITDITKRSGYLSSSREGGAGGDDIYSFKGDLGNRTLHAGRIYAYDEQSTSLLKGALVSVVPCDIGTTGAASGDNAFNAKLIPVPGKDGEFTLRIVSGDAASGTSSSGEGKLTDMKGEVTYDLECNKEYCIYVEKSGYRSAEKRFVTSDCEDGIELAIPMRRESAAISSSVNYTTSASADMMLNGMVINKLYNTSIPNATVYLTNSCTGETSTALSTADGTFSFPADCGCDYTLKGEKVGLGTITQSLSTMNVDCSQPIQTKLLLGGTPPSVISTPAPVTIPAYRPATTTLSNVTNYTVGDVIELEHIYYDFDKADIRRDATIDLDKLANILQRYPAMTIELSSHTDARAVDVYNLDLSQRRAQAAIEYLVAKGIGRSRLVPKGYGETQPRNHCVDGIKCSELEHQRNRRTEIRVLTTQSNVDVRYIDNEPEYIDIPGQNISPTLPQGNE